MAGSLFRFDLDPVLRLRDRAVEQARAALGDAVAARTAREASVRQARLALDAMLGAGGRPSRTVHQIGGAAAHRETLARRLAEGVLDLERAQAHEARAQRALGVATRELEALRTLRAEAAAAHRVRALRTEAAVLDDLAVLGHASEARRSAAALPR